MTVYDIVSKASSDVVFVITSNDLRRDVITKHDLKYTKYINSEVVRVCQDFEGDICLEIDF